MIFLLSSGLGGSYDFKDLAHVVLFGAAMFVVLPAFVGVASLFIL